MLAVRGKTAVSTAAGAEVREVERRIELDRPAEVLLRQMLRTPGHGLQVARRIRTQQAYEKRLVRRRRSQCRRRRVVRGHS